MPRKNVAKTYTDKTGRFAKGNPGRPKGARHKASQAIEQLLEGEAKALTRKAIDLALDGDTTALRLCLERIAPARKDAAVRFPFPNQPAFDVRHVRADQRPVVVELLNGVHTD